MRRLRKKEKESPSLDQPIGACLIMYAPDAQAAPDGWARIKQLTLAEKPTDLWVIRKERFGLISN